MTHTTLQRATETLVARWSLELVLELERRASMRKVLAKVVARATTQIRHAPFACSCGDDDDANRLVRVTLFLNILQLFAHVVR